MLAQGKVRADGPPAQIKSDTGPKTVRFALSGPDPAALLRLPGVTAADVRGERVTLTTTDADVTVPALYANGLGVRDIEVAGSGLENALLALAGEGEVRR